MIQALLSRTEPQAMPSTQFKQLVGDLSNAIKTSYGKVAPILAGGKAGAGAGGSSFLESLGLTGLAKSYKEKAEAKEARRQSKEDFVGNFQKYSEAGQNLSADTSRQVAESLFEEIDAKLQDLKKLEQEAKTRKEAGYGEDKNNTEQQNKLIEEIKKLQPNYGKEESPQDKAIGAVQDEERKIEQAETQQKQYETETKISDDITALYTISDDYFKKMLEKTDKMLESLEAIKENGAGGGGGGLLGTAAELAGDLMGGKGKAAGKVGKVGRLASMAGKLGTVAKVGGGLLAVGTAAYEGYQDYQAADEQVKSGEITKEQGQVKKGEAVGGAAGGAGGALAGAAAGAALGSVVPVVGTAIGGLIGGALGYFGGKKAGQVVGGGAVKGYQALSGGTGTDMEYDAMGNPTGMPASTTPAASAANTSTSQSSGKPKSDDFKMVIREGQGAGNTIDTRSFMNPYAAEATLTGKTNTPPAPVRSLVAPSPWLAAPDQSSAETARLLRQNTSAAGATSGKDLKNSTSELDQFRMEIKEGQGKGNIIDSRSFVTNVSGIQAAEKSIQPKDTSNKDSTFQRWLDRRYYPAKSF